MNGEGFLAMGGYAAFVWPAFGIVFAALVWNVAAARRLLAQAREQALRRAADGGRP